MSDHRWQMSESKTTRTQER